MAPLAAVILAVVPPVLFLIWILRFDRIEPEPLGLILKLLFLGCLSVIPAAFIESSLMGQSIFQGSGVAAAALQSFLLIAPVEETFKLLIVLLFVWRNTNFNEPNDGIVYAGTVSIGFAMAENLFYVFEHGLAVGIARAITSIPGHTFTGVLMGYFLGLARFAPTPKLKIKNVSTGLLIAWFLHGTYDTFALSGTNAALLLIPMVAALFILGIRYLKKGRDLSASRWATVGEQQTEPAAVKPGRKGCVKVLARTLLAVSALFWLIIILGLLLGEGPELENTVDIIAGSLLLTAVPIAAGVVLEISHRKNKLSK